MKSRTIAIVLTCFLIIAGLAWFLYRPANTSARGDVTYQSESSKVEMPKLPPAQIGKSTAPAVVKSASADAQSPDQVASRKSQAVTEVHAYIDKVTDLLQSGDIINAMEITESPEIDAKLFPNSEIKGRFYQAMQKEWARPSRQQYHDEPIQHLLSLKNQTPTINDAGTEVTYFWSGVVFTKIDGVWYITKGRGF
jgi:hypothetical protein